jgi:ferric-dicitrate binding protein FerR (iron transport regulator)
MSDDRELSDFERRTKRVFDDSVAALDAATRSRLTQARHRALEERSPVRSRGWLMPAGAAAATALVAWLVVWQSPPASDAVQGTPLTDLEILLGEQDLEMLDGWLEEQPEFTDPNDSVG